MSDLSSILTILFFIIFVVWVVFTLIAAYHWLRYGRNSGLALPAICTYVVVSGILIFLTASGVA